MEACELLTVELRLDQIEAEIAIELPPHMRSFAHAHVHGLPPPPAPEVLGRASTLATARAALVHPFLADRGLALLRLAAPIAIASDPAVRTAHAMPATWAALAALATARDAVAVARFGRRAIDVVHRLHGSAVDRFAASGADGAGAELPPAVAGWFAPDGIAVDDAAVAQRWHAIRACHGVDGSVRFDRAARARPRAFVVEPRRDVILALPARIATPAERFAVLHELGHAVAALALSAGIPRVIDEAVAAYVARAIERESDAWYTPLAVAARIRRRALAGVLDWIERALPELPEIHRRPGEHPPSALWEDPGTQAAYVAAESLAEDLERAIGVSPAPGALVAALSAARDAIDRAGAGGTAI
jgi:hypothetical protein